VAAGAWEERKSDGTTYAFEVARPSGATPVDSRSVRLRMKDTATEVLLTEASAHIFVEGRYFGEYSGQWEVDGVPEAPPSAQAVPTGVNPALSRESPGGATERPSYPSAGPKVSQAGGPAAAYKSGPTGATTLLPGALPSAAPRQPASGPARPPVAPYVAPPQKANNLDRSPEQASKITASAKAGDVVEVRRLLEQGVDPDVIGPGGQTALMSAAAGGHLQVAEALLAAGADANVGKDGSTPMTIAFQKGQKEMLRLLFQWAFQRLETVVGHGAVSWHEIQAFDREAPENAMDDLREVTTKLASLSGSRQEVFPASDQSEFPISSDEYDGMRTEAIKDAMRTLSHAKKVALAEM